MGFPTRVGCDSRCVEDAHRAEVVELTPSHTPSELRRLATRSKDASQSRRLLSIAAFLDGMNRAEAARIGAIDRQRLRDWAELERLPL